MGVATAHERRAPRYETLRGVVTLFIRLCVFMSNLDQRILLDSLVAAQILLSDQSSFTP